MPILSIVVPIYNVEKYLQDCIASLLFESNNDIEIVLVDDGSPDRSPEICDTWARMDNRITVIHKVNGGLSDARNVGLQIAKGKYVWFVDSDDMLMDNAISTVISTIQDRSEINVFCTPLQWSFPEATCNFVDINIENDIIINSHDYIRKQYPIWASQRFIIRREFILENNLHFPKGLIHEDEYFGRCLLYYAKDLYVFSDSLYYYRQREQSIVNTKNTRSIYDWALICLLIREFIDSEVKEEDFSLMITDLVCMYFDLYRRIYSIYIYELDDFNRKHLKDIRAFLLRTMRYQKFSLKCRTLCFQLFPKLAVVEFR